MSNTDDFAQIDPAAAEKAFTEIRPLLLAIPEGDLVQVNLVVQKAAIAAWAVGRKVQEPAMRARFKHLPKSEFDQANVDELETVALALVHATIKLFSAGASSSEAKLPVSLVQQATAIKQRMLKLLDYYFEDDPEDGAEIASIKLGTGYVDLASDLFRLAALYKKRHTEIKDDSKHYVSSDASDARKSAHEILRLLGEAKNQDAKTWSDLTVRGLTLLFQVYDEVAAAGRWLYRKENGDARFPSLYVAGRPSGARAKKEKAPEGAGSEGEAKDKPA